MDVPKRIVFINGGIIMKTENRFMLGTIDEVSEEIAVLEDNEEMFSFSKDTVIIAEWLEE